MSNARWTGCRHICRTHALADAGILPGRTSGTERVMHGVADLFHRSSYGRRMSLPQKIMPYVDWICNPYRILRVTFQVQSGGRQADRSSFRAC